MRFDAAEARLRVRTQTVGATKKLSSAGAKVILNDRYRNLRTRLQVWAPEQYLHTTGDLTLAAGDWFELTSMTAPFEHLERLETREYTIDSYPIELEEWIPVAKASHQTPGRHEVADIAWERRGGRIYLQPEGLVAGVFRLHYHFTPSDLVNASDVFEFPGALDDYFITMCAVDVYEGFRDYKEAGLQRARAEGRDGEGGELGAALDRLGDEDGAHQDYSGLQWRRGY